MKLNNYKTVVVLIFLLSYSITSNAQSRKKKQAEKDTVEWNYEIACEGTGLQGTYLVKVWSYSKRPKVAIEQAKKNAVHGIIFKGFVGNSSNGCKTQKSLSRSANIQEEHRSFFKSFFSDGGKYMKFVNLSTDGSVRANDRLKVKRNLYKIAVVVSVNKDALRKDLEEAGIIKKLTSGF